MRLTISSTFHAPADRVWFLVKKSSTLLFVTRGLLGFSGSEHFPAEWREGATETTRLLFFNFIPAWKHSLTVREVSDNNRVLYTNEGGGLVPVWNHHIQVTPGDNETCTYTDRVEIKAGMLRFLVWGYAYLFYRYRQARWRVLLLRTPHHRSAVIPESGRGGPQDQ